MFRTSVGLTHLYLAPLLKYVELFYQQTSFYEVHCKS
jgi:hypothetical protein